MGLGAGLPRRGIAVLADTFQNNPWTKESTAELLQGLKEEGELRVDRNPELPPWKALYADHRVAPYGNDIPWQDLGHVDFATVRALVSARAIVWGLSHEREMPVVFANAKVHYEQTARSAIPSGLDVPAQYPWDSLDRFYESCEELVLDFESTRPPLPEIPRALREAPEVVYRLDSNSGART